MLIVLRPCSSMSTDFRYALLFSKTKTTENDRKVPNSKNYSYLIVFGLNLMHLFFFLSYMWHN